MGYVLMPNVHFLAEANGGLWRGADVFGAALK